MRVVEPHHLVAAVEPIIGGVHSRLLSPVT
jgi:hypothetical protein